MNKLTSPVLLLGLALPLAAAPRVPAKPQAKPATKAPIRPRVTKPVPKPTPRPTPRPTLKPAPNPAPPLVVPAQPVMPPTEPAAPVSPPQPPAPAGPKTWALLVGVSRYQSPQINALRYPAKDAAGLRDTLINPQLGNVPAAQVRLLADEGATRQAIEGAVDTFLRPNVQPGDKVIVFLAGHGVAKGVGLEARSYLLPTDARGLTTASLESSAVNLKELSKKLGTLPARQFVLFVDACREDPMPGRGIKGNTLTDVLSRGIQVVPQAPGAESATFFACSVGERAYEDPTLGHGVFTNSILKGITEAAVPTRPDGAVDMGRLSSFVSQRVAQWTREASNAGTFELQQTPELVSHGVVAPLVLMKVKRPLSEAPLAVKPPRLLVAASPEGATVTINGQKAGQGTVGKEVPAEGEYNITVTAPGYAPVARTVQALGGYEQQLVVKLEPAPGPVSGADYSDPSPLYLKRAREAEAQGQYEVAEQGYLATINANPKILAAHEALYDLHRAQGRNQDALSDALALVEQSPRSAESFARLSRAYSHFAEKGAGADNATSSLKSVAGYGGPRNAEDAASLAQKAANQAISLDANATSGHLAQGYALAAQDGKGKNRRAALLAFGKAVFLGPQESANHLGLGYGIRYYATLTKKEEDKRSELGRAVTALQEAVRLKPDSYDAHRELGYCYTLLGETDKALASLNMANSYRGAASDANEVAGTDLAMAGLHQKKAGESTDAETKAAHSAASEGYMAEAKETAPDLKVAMRVLNQVGVSTSLGSYMPAELRPLMDIKGTVESEIRRNLPAIPGIRLPRF